MARIRNVKPELWANEGLSACTAEAHMLAAALLNYADDDGYFNAHPELVRSGTLPLRHLSTTIPVLLSELAAIGYIALGYQRAKRVGRIVEFRTHQRVAKPSRTKWRVGEIEWDAVPIDSNTTTAPLPEPSTTIPVALPESSTTVPVVVAEPSTTVPVVLPESSTTIPVEVTVGSGTGSGTGSGSGTGKGTGKGKGTGNGYRATNRAPRRAPRALDTDEPPGFVEFWQAYPRKIAKAAARKAWKAKGCEAIAQRITADVRQRKAANWLGKDAEFIPHPATYLNGARWTDELEYPPEPKPDTGRIGAAMDRLRARMAHHDAGLQSVGTVIEAAADDWGVPP